ncbi:MAG TPA: glycosyltransferase family 39 protein [Chloroflexia bacterium]|nr:glycosyltransferase family 39 protein [Chloroflexia bacterium]
MQIAVVFAGAPGSYGYVVFHLASKGLVLAKQFSSEIQNITLLKEQPGEKSEREKLFSSGVAGWLWQRRAGLALSLIILLAAALRLFVLLKAHFIPDGDEALTGVMAKHILEGERPVFTYGQHYMAATEAYFTAVIYAFFGVSAWGMKIAPFLASLGLVGLNYAVALRYLGTKRAGLFAATLTAFPSLYFTVLGLRAWNHSTETMVCGALLLLVAWSLLWGPPSPPEARRWWGYTRREWLLWGTLGLLVGFSFYGHMLAVYYYLPIIFFLFLKDKLFALRPVALVTVAGFFVGSCPWWIYNLQNNWATITSFIKPDSGDKKAPLDVLNHYAAYSVPLMTGAYNYWFPVAALAGVFLNSVFLLTLAGWFVARWRGIGGWFRLSFKSARPVDLLLLLVIFSPLIYLAWGAGNVAFTDLDTTGRYLIPLFGVLPVLVGGGLASFGRWLSTYPWLKNARTWQKTASLTLVTLVLLAVCGTNLYLYRHADFVAAFQSPYFPQLRPPLDNGPLINYLKSQDIEYATCNHWVGNRIIVDSAEAIKCVDYHDVSIGGLDRFKSYTAGILEPGRKVAFVLLNLDQGAAPLENKLHEMGVQYTRKDFLPYIVIIPTSRPVSPKEVVDELHYPM